MRHEEAAALAAGAEAHLTGALAIPAGSSSDWHSEPAPQYVITLSGTLEFGTRLGETCTLAPGTILLAEESEGGGGHRWRLTDGQPWRRAYVILE